MMRPSLPSFCVKKAKGHPFGWPLTMSITYFWVANKSLELVRQTRVSLEGLLFERVLLAFDFTLGDATTEIEFGALRERIDVASSKADILGVEVLFSASMFDVFDFTVNEISTNLDVAPASASKYVPT